MTTITCPKCSYTRKPTETAPDYACPSCGIVYAKFDSMAHLDMRLDRATKTGDYADIAAEQMTEKGRVQLRAHEAARPRHTLLLTTTPTVPGREIAGVLDIVAAECVYGMNLFKDIFARLTDIVGGRSGVTQGVLRDTRRTVLAELRREAMLLGADAVVGVHLAVSEFSGGGKSMLFMVATGTAVKLVPA